VAAECRCCGGTAPTCELQSSQHLPTPCSMCYQHPRCLRAASRQQDRAQTGGHSREEEEEALPGRAGPGCSVAGGGHTRVWRQRGPGSGYSRSTPRAQAQEPFPAPGRPLAPTAQPRNPLAAEPGAAPRPSAGVGQGTTQGGSTGGQQGLGGAEGARSAPRPV